jgi:ceramide glucosyltransferase
MLIIIILLTLLSAASIYFYLYSIYAAIDLFNHSEPVDLAFCPSVSILKPLCGLDQDTYQNLASFCQQEYPEYQIIFGVQNSQDPVLSVVERITQDFAGVDICCVVCDRAVGVNPKVNNLANIVTAAKHSILVIADSDIRVEPDYLRRIIQPLKNSQVGVVTCLYRSLAKGWVSTLEALGVAIENHAQVLVERKMFGMKAAIGATIVMRRSVLDEIGGFATTADYLMDDHQLAHQVLQAGHQIVLSNYVVNHVLLPGTFSSFFQHQLRWAVSIRASRFWGYAGIILTHGTTVSLLLLLITSGRTVAWIVLSVTWSIRLIMAWTLGVHYLQEPSVKQCFGLIPLRDLLSSIMWFCGLFGNTVQWRDRTLKIGKDGRLYNPSQS